MEVKNIIVNKQGHTIGATIIKNDDSEIRLKTSDLLKAKNESNIKFENAIITNSGFVRAKSGNLPKIVSQSTAYHSNKQKKNNKDFNEYILMLKDIRVCSFNRYNGTAIIYNESLMPFDIYLEDDEYADKQNNITVFNWWCAHRVLSIDREHAKVILNSCGLRQAITDKDKADIALQYKCLSLKDFYWVKKKIDKIRWEDVNLFDNSLSNAVVNLALRGENLSVTNKHLIDSDLTTDGVFPKAWYRKGHTFYLYKGDKDSSVDKEVRASKILQQLGFKVLNYEKTVYDNEEVAVSKCFTSKDVGYVTAGDMIQNYDIDTDYYAYDIMNLCDYLVGNSDRHQDNWGYIFNDNREIIGFAPIIDFNHAFEAAEQFLCLPEQLLGRNITMLDMARAVVKKHNIKLTKIAETDDYTKFVNRRIELLNPAGKQYRN